MLTFKPVAQRDLSRLRRYYKNCNYQLCEYSALVKLMWRGHLHPQYAEAAGCLIVKNCIDGKPCFDYPVLGPDGDEEAALCAIEDYCVEQGISLELSVVPKEKAAKLLERYPRFHLNNFRSWRDYIYEANDLREFPGRHYSGQRNHINKFRKEYPTAKFIPLTGADMPLIENFWADYEQEFQKTSFNAKRELAYAKALARLLPEGWLLGGGLLVQRTHLADSGLQELHAHAILAGLDDNGAVGDSHNAAIHAADGGQPVALLQGAAHFLGLLFPLALRTDQHKVENGHHQDDQHDRRHTAASSGSIAGRGGGIGKFNHGTKTPFSRI